MLPMSVAFSGGRHRPFQCSRRHPEGVEMSRRRHVTLVPSLQSSLQPPALESRPGSLELFPVIRVMVVCLLQILCICLPCVKPLVSNPASDGIAPSPKTIRGVLHSNICVHSGVIWRILRTSILHSLAVQGVLSIIPCVFSLHCHFANSFLSRIVF